MVSISSFLDLFYAKASKKGFDLRPRLGILLGISNDSKRMIKKLDRPIKEFVEHTKMLRLQNTEPYLTNLIIAVHEKTVQTGFLCKDILIQLKLSAELPIGYNKIPKKSYKQWKKDPEIDVALLETLNTTISETALDYSKLHEMFKEHMEAADQTNVIVEKYFDSANTSFDAILNLTPTTKNSNCIVSEAKKIMTEIMKEQIQLLMHLESMTNILKVYNEHRLRLIEYIVGLRDSFDANVDEIEVVLHY